MYFTAFILEYNIGERITKYHIIKIYCKKSPHLKLYLYDEEFKESVRRPDFAGGRNKGSDPR